MTETITWLQWHSEEGSDEEKHVMVGGWVGGREGGRE